VRSHLNSPIDVRVLKFTVFVYHAVAGVSGGRLTSWAYARFDAPVIAESRLLAISL
jgi:hypothetical protein